MLAARPRGTGDILPGEVEKWRRLEDLIRRICREYGYAEIRTPVFEHTELFRRGVGETTDIVEKEMYTFTDRGGRSITLRPEGTAPVVRAYVENGLYNRPQPVKLFYVGPMFRYDRPQAGRFRQFHQFGVEVFGSDAPAIDAEVIAMAVDFCARAGLSDLELHLNSLGCPECRPVLREKLAHFFRRREAELCPDCRERLERNPLRILDCKEERCRNAGKDAPTSLGCLCHKCAGHFQSVKRCLDRLQVSYLENGRLVRGLDYYTGTAFEIMTRDTGAQSSIGGGGRYDGLVEACGGPPTPGIGYAFGLERLILAGEKQGTAVPESSAPPVFIATAGEKAGEAAFELLFKLRRAGLPAGMDYLGRSLKAQMKYAGKAGIRFVLIIGDDELARGLAVVRDMASGGQEEVSLEEVAAYLALCLENIPAGERQRP
jgi:histidyl-tRNA synthetase